MPESESEQHEAQINLTQAVEDPNQSSGEPKASYAQEGKPQSMTYLLSNLCNLLFLYTCAFKFTKVGWNLSYMILGTYVWTLVGLGR